MARARPIGHWCLKPCPPGHYCWCADEKGRGAAALFRHKLGLATLRARTAQCGRLADWKGFARNRKQQP